MSLLRETDFSVLCFPLGLRESLLVVLPARDFRIKRRAPALDILRALRAMMRPESAVARLSKRTDDPRGKE